MAALTYYIDGYNVIHFSTLLRPIAMEDFERARDALVEKVARFCTATGHQAKIVFDGRGRRMPPIAPIAGTPHLEVMFSPGEQSADALIERIVYTASNPRALVVVTGDRGIRELCRNFNALVMEPDNFLASIREIDADNRVKLDHIQRHDTLLRVENRLPGASLERLREIKDGIERQGSGQSGPSG